MSKEQTLNLDPRMESAVGDLKVKIQERYPTASFDVALGDDPEGVYLRAIVDLDEVDEVLDLVLDPLFEYQVLQELPIYVIPLQPLERVLRELRTLGKKQTLTSVGMQPDLSRHGRPTPRRVPKGTS